MSILDVIQYLKDRIDYYEEDLKYLEDLGSRTDEARYRATLAAQYELSRLLTLIDEHLETEEKNED